MLIDEFPMWLVGWVLKEVLLAKNAVTIARIISIDHGTYLWCILPRDVRTLTFCQLMGFPLIKPRKVKLLAEQISQPRYVSGEAP